MFVILKNIISQSLIGVINKIEIWSPDTLKDFELKKNILKQMTIKSYVMQSID